MHNRFYHIPVTGLPAEGKFGGEPYGENGYAYMAVTVTTGEHPAFYKIDTKTGKAIGSGTSPTVST